MKNTSESDLCSCEATFKLLKSSWAKKAQKKIMLKPQNLCVCVCVCVVTSFAAP